MTVDSTACTSIEWKGATVSTSGTYYDTLQNAAGCDSIVTLNLTINQTSLILDTHEACDTFTWIDGNTYTADNSSATYTLTNAAGCDSVVVLDLTIHTSPTVSLGNDTTICDGNTLTLDAGAGYTLSLIHI